jgi:hypothetical protein
MDSWFYVVKILRMMYVERLSSINSRHKCKHIDHAQASHTAQHTGTLMMAHFSLATKCLVSRVNIAGAGVSSALESLFTRPAPSQ